MIIQHNIAALNSARQLSSNNSSVSKNLEKLSSGYRINRAGDDAAGLAISEKMKAQVKGLETASKNANDGISLVQTGEGALTEVHSMLNRMTELATQSANGTYDDGVDRKNLQKEVDSLTQEIDRISKSTNYNGIKLLDGSLGGSSAAGGLAGAPIATYKGAVTAAIAGANASTAHVEAKKQVSTYEITAALVDTNTFNVGGITITAATAGAAPMTVAGNDGKIALSGGDRDVQGADIATMLNQAHDLGINAAASDYTWSYSATDHKLTATARNAGTVGAAPTDAARTLGPDGGTLAAPEVTVTAGANETGIDYFDKDTINVDGTDVKIDWSKLSDADKTALQKDWLQTDGTVKATDAEAAAKILTDTINSAITAQNAANGTNLSAIKVEASGDDTHAKTFTFTSGQKDGSSKLSFTGTANSVLGQTVGTSAVVTNAPVTKLSISPDDANGKFTMKLNDQSVEVAMSGLTSSSTAADVVAKLQSSINTALANYDTANGLTGDDATAGKIQVKINDSGALEFTNTTDKKISFEDKDGGEVAKTLGISTEGKATAAGGLSLQVGESNEDFQRVNVNIGEMSTKALGIEGIDIRTQAGSEAAMVKIKEAINTVSATRGDLGAIQNRLEHTINNLGVTQENMTAAESRIRDVDMAKEMMDYTKNNILVQASQAMLAQANQQPQGVLQLLK